MSQSWEAARAKSMRIVGSLGTEAKVSPHSVCSNPRNTNLALYRRLSSSSLMRYTHLHETTLSLGGTTFRSRYYQVPLSMSDSCSSFMTCFQWRDWSLRRACLYVCGVTRSWMRAFDAGADTGADDGADGVAKRAFLVRDTMGFSD